MLNWLRAPDPAELQPGRPAWLTDVELLIVDFGCLVHRFPIAEEAMREDLRQLLGRRYW